MTTKEINNKEVKIEVTPSCQYALSSGETHLYVQLKLKAPEIVISGDKRLDLNLGVVLDRSGSMSGKKLDYAKRAIRFIIENIQKEDIFSLIIYDDQIETLIPATPLTNNTSDILNKINKITARNMTDLHGGMIQGAREVEKNLPLEKRNVIMLLSDGLANVGITRKDLVAKSAEKIYSEKGISISTFGVGDDFDEDMLVGIADAASGEFYYIKDPDEIPTFIEKELKGLLTTVLANVEISWTHPEGIQVKKILGVSLDDQRKSTARIGDLRSGKERLVILDLIVPPKKEDFTEEIINFQIKGTSALGDSLEEITQTASCSITFTNNEELIMKENQEVMDNVAILETTLIQEEAIRLADQGRFEEARNIVFAQQTILRQRSQMKGASEKIQTTLGINADLLDNVFELRKYSKSSRKRAKSMSYDMRKSK